MNHGECHTRIHTVDLAHSSLGIPRLANRDVHLLLARFPNLAKLPKYLFKLHTDCATAYQVYQSVLIISKYTIPML